MTARKAATAAAATVTRVDPKTLLIGPNVRKEVTLRKEFVTSVQLHGVLVPIIAQQSTDGLEVVDGQMRTLAAIDAGLSEVPVFVQPAIADEASRIVEQIVVNEDRASLTSTDHVAAIAQLALDFKMPAAEIAKRTGATKDQVAQIVTASKSPQATAAIGQEGVTLELAARIAEAGLSKADTARVVEARWNKEHMLQQVLDERDRATLTKQLEKEFKAAGVTIATKPTAGEYSPAEKNKHMFLDQLVDKTTDKQVTLKTHGSCPGHAVFIGVRGYNGKVEAHYLCTEPAKYGHRDVNRAVPKKLTDEERAQRKAEAEKSAEWLSISTVRRDWIRDQLLTRRTVPAGWERLVVAQLISEYSSAEAWTPWKETVAGLLQIEPSGDSWNRYTDAFRDEASKSPAIAARVALGIIVGRHEQAIADAKAKGWAVISPVYLELLGKWGYGLSEIEQGIVGGAS